MGDSIGSMNVEIRANRDKIAADMNSIKNDIFNKGKEIEDRFSKIKMDVDNRAMYMKISEMKQYAADLKAKLSEQIKMNVDFGDIEKTKVELDQVTQKLQGFTNEAGTATGSATSFFSKLGLAMAEVFAIKKIADFTTESISLAAELQDLKKAFKGTTEDLELFQRATAGTVDDGDLYKLSNLALALGISLKDQPKLFLLATNAVRDYGGTIQEKFEGIIRASEGMVRGIGQLGIERGAFTQRVKELAAAEGDSIVNLDSEIAKRIRIQAIMELSGITLEDVKNREQTLNERIKALPVIIQEAKESFGKLFEPLLATWLPKAIEMMKDLGRRIKELSTGRPQIAAETVMLPPDFGKKTLEERAQYIKDYQKQLDDLKNKKYEWTPPVATPNANANNPYFIPPAANTSPANEDKMQEQIHNDQIAMATYENLIKLAKEYKDVKDGSGSDSGSGDKEKEKVSMAIEELKFMYAGYYEYKIDLINKEAEARKKDGQDGVIVEMAKYNKLRELAREYLAFINKEFPTEGFTGDANIKLPKIDELVNKVPGKLPLGKDPGSNFNIQETNEQLKEEIALTESLKEGFESAGNALANSMGNAVQIFGQTNSLLEQFINNLGQAIVKSLAEKAGGWIVNGILAMIGAHDGGSFVGTSSGVMKMASGGSFTVPNGYPRDSFPLMVESGERVTVTPANQVNNFNNSADMSGVINAIKIMNANLVNGSGNNKPSKPQRLYGSLDGNDIYISNERSGKIYKSQR